MKKILITGSEGQLAQCLIHHPLAKNHTLLAFNKQTADITDTEGMLAVLKKEQPDVIINTAAYTAVDLAETERSTAHAVNALAPLTLANYCQTSGTRLIHLSTDYVFKGDSTHPYHEDDAIQPVNYYGETKALGEAAVRDQLDNHVILRVSGVFSEYGKNFLKTMLKLASDKEYLSIVGDQTTCPTDAHAIAGAIYELINQKDIRGTYHYCSKLPVTWHHFAASIFGAAIARHNLPFKCHTIKRITSDAYVTAAKRPAYSVLNCDKIRRDAGIAQPSLQASIDRVIDVLLRNPS